MFKRICHIAVSCLLAQCAGTIKVMPEYKNINVENSRLGIVLLKENMVIKNQDDIARYLGDGETNQVFYNFFNEYFKKYAPEHGRFGETTMLDGCDTSRFRKSAQSLFADDSVHLRLPSKAACDGDSLPYLLILDCFDISREQYAGKKVVTTGSYGTMGVRTVGAYDNLIMKGTFVLWDNLAEKIVSFGKINEKTDALTSGMTKQTWITAVENISSKIFVDTPYGMPSVPPVE